jgi:hypothetical protein
LSENRGKSSTNPINQARRAAIRYQLRHRAKQAMPIAVVERLVDLRERLFAFRDRSSDEQLLRQVLQRAYKTLVAPDREASAERPLVARVRSQNDEDGMLLWIFERIGAKHFTFVEIGAGNGRECNTANLSINFGWRGLLIDGDVRNVDLARSFYARRGSADVTILRSFVTAESVNGLISSAGLEGEIDLLSIDVDGMDYWIWKAISVVTPRVVVIEYNSGLGVEACHVVPYDPAFDRFALDPTGLYYGASLAALAKLADSQGFALVGCTAGINAFFVARSCTAGRFEELSPEQAHASSLH